MVTKQGYRIGKINDVFALWFISINLFK
jgi:hypothetical protein